MNLKHKLIKITGDIYLHKYPMWIVYKPAIHPIKEKDIKDIQTMIMFGDILLRRFDGYLNTIFTSRIFRSYWGHAAIYVGDGRIAHAVGSGVIFEDLHDFCRTDAVCVLQRKDYAEEIAASVVSQAMELEVKDAGYDFDFVLGDNKYYCTEFVDVINDGLFGDDYVCKFGEKILTPDGIRHSKKVRLKIEVIPKLRKRKEKRL